MKNISTLTNEDYIIQLRTELLGAEENLKLVLDMGEPEVEVTGVARDFYVCLRSVRADIFLCDQAIRYGVEIPSLPMKKPIKEALLEFTKGKQ